MALIKWVDIDRWTEIDMEELTKQAEALSTEETKAAIKDAVTTIKNSLNLLEKKKTTKEKRDRMTKERINILLRLGFEIHLKDPAKQPVAQVQEQEASLNEKPS
jgi:predicted secreted acid phosphatase